MKLLWRRQGVAGLSQTVADRLLHRTFSIAVDARFIATGASTLEIGGPSAKFAHSNILPLYPYVKTLDNVNFAGATLWEQNLLDGGAYSPAGTPLGIQYLREAVDLQGFTDNRYDLVISSHTLEHLANPVAALREWRRVCRPHGHLILILPHADATFDRRRPITTIAHLLADEANSVDESDAYHAAEVLELHDFRRDPDAQKSGFPERIRRNLEYRAMHHHVFDIDLALRTLRETGWNPLAAEGRRPHNMVLIGCNEPLSPTRQVVRKSPFPSDRPLLPRLPATFYARAVPSWRKRALISSGSERWRHSVSPPATQNRASNASAKS